MTIAVPIPMYIRVSFGLGSRSGLAYQYPAGEGSI